MATTKTMPKQEVTTKILAQTLHDLNPSRSVQEWEEHVKKTGNDPKAFFAGNGEGLEEYLAFTRTYDKDIHDRNTKSKTRRKSGE